MSDALLRMTAWLIQSPGWHADRMASSGPSFKESPKGEKDTRRRTYHESNPTLVKRILTELERGKATSDEIAKRLHTPQQEVGAKLSRLYADGHVERALSATSPHTGRKVLMYWLRRE